MKVRAYSKRELAGKVAFHIGHIGHLAVGTKNGFSGNWFYSFDDANFVGPFRTRFKAQRAYLIHERAGHSGVLQGVD